MGVKKLFDLIKQKFSHESQGSNEVESQGPTNAPSSSINIHSQNSNHELVNSDNINESSQLTQSGDIDLNQMSESSIPDEELSIDSLDSSNTTKSTKKISSQEWSMLTLNAKDGGANSVLAANVLNKTSKLLQEADKEVLSMLDSGADIKKDVIQLNEFATEIKAISMNTKIVALNISIEASRAGENGKAFKVIATEMQNLSDKVNALTVQIEQSLGEINQRVILNDEKCNKVAEIFADVHLEVTQFNDLMMRIEELATTQVVNLGEIEKVLVSSSDMMNN